MSLNGLLSKQIEKSLKRVEREREREQGVIGTSTTIGLCRKAKNPILYCYSRVNIGTNDKWLGITMSA